MDSASKTLPGLKFFLSAIVGGVSCDKIEQFVSHFLKMTLEQKIKKSARYEIQQHKNSGHKLVLVTTSFDFYSKKLGERLGFDAIICTMSRWDKNDRLVGDIDGHNCYGSYKIEKVSQYIKDNMSRTYSILYTDHHSDLPLMEWVDEGIAVNSTKKMRELATANNYKIRDW